MWRKANGLSVVPTKRSSSKERTKETAPLPAGGADDTTPPASGIHNLVSAKGEGDVDEREIFSSDSSHGEAYDGHEAQVLNCLVTVYQAEYFLNESAN